ncbi:hypothetical protein T10_4098 [Trichinella papuae]|uniref:Uncharacterized protein n=1 Tax=Trichinella papuae TaxID=268474 RepID=A0A0V1M7B2_9BILA|nr:hypothetical protein T10_4098 [Trichinella papuae]
MPVYWGVFLHNSWAVDVSTSCHLPAKQAVKLGQIIRDNSSGIGRTVYSATFPFLFHLNVITGELVGRDGSRRSGHRISAFVRFWKCDHVAYRLRAGQQRQISIQADGEAAVRWRAEFQRLQQVRHLVGVLVQHVLQDVLLHGRPVDPYRAAAQFHSVQHQIVVSTEHRQGILVQQLLLTNGRRRERMVSALQTAVFTAHEQRKLHNPAELERIRTTNINSILFYKFKMEQLKRDVESFNAVGQVDANQTQTSLQVMQIVRVTDGDQRRRTQITNPRADVGQFSLRDVERSSCWWSWADGPVAVQNHEIEIQFRIMRSKVTPQAINVAGADRRQTVAQWIVADDRLEMGTVGYDTIGQRSQQPVETTVRLVRAVQAHRVSVAENSTQTLCTVGLSQNYPLAYLILGNGASGFEASCSGQQWTIRASTSAITAASSVNDSSMSIWVNSGWRSDLLPSSL